MTKRRLRNAAGVFVIIAYSQRKKRMESTVQSAVRPSITQTGSSMLPVSAPMKVFFIIVMPCVSGKRLTIFCIARGCR